MSEYVFPFEKLDVWQMTVDLAEYVLDLLEDFPPNKHFQMVGQMEAAVTSTRAKHRGRERVVDNRKNSFNSYISLKAHYMKLLH